MKFPKSLSVILLSFLLTTFLVACSKSEETEESEHFASSQQKALEKAQGVEDMLQETEEKRRKEMEQADQ